MIKTLSVLLVVTFMASGLAFVPAAQAADAAPSVSSSEMHTLERKNVDVLGNLDKDVNKGDVKKDKDCDCKECAGKKGKKSCKTCKHCKMRHHHHGDKESDAAGDAKEKDADPAKKE